MSDECPKCGVVTRSVEIPEAAVDYLGRLWWKQYDTESPYQHAQSVAKTREAIEGLLPYLAPVGDGGLREALGELRTDLDRSYPDRAQYDIPSTVIDRIDAALAAHPAAPAVPQPVDREALRKRICAVLLDHEVGERLTMVGAVKLRNEIADAVLAVLAGEQEQVEP